MYTVVIHVYNRFNEIETERSFCAKTKSAARSKATAWCKQGWGKDWKNMFSDIRFRLSHSVMSTDVWELR